MDNMPPLIGSYSFDTDEAWQKARAYAEQQTAELRALLKESAEAMRREANDSPTLAYLLSRIDGA